ncbi:MAG: DNA internalization-related competence protein ComEC/Rec2 [Deltaproteobacteria bacterium]|nr:DNA internalization-related competence protein ComEC/Rec2 [Deltaproteobacteria bacterium]
MKERILFYVLFLLVILRCFYLDLSLKPPHFERTQEELVFQIETVTNQRTQVHISQRGRRQVDEKAFWYSQTSFHEGDKIKGVFHIELLRSLSNPGIRWTEKNYYRERIYWKIKEEKIYSRTCQHSWSQNLRRSIFKKFNQFESASFLKILILGFPDKDKSFEDVQEFGLSHLFVISGMHLSVLFYFMYGLFYLIGGTSRYRLSFIVSFLFSGLYVSLCYSQISLTRSFFMLTLVVCNVILERRSNLIRVFELTSLIVLVLEPLELFQPSFQFSSAAVLAIALGFESRRKNWFKEMLFLQMFITLFVAPLVAYYFHEFSISGIFLNLIFIPVFSYLLPLLFIGTGALLINLNDIGTFCFKVGDFFFEILRWTLCVFPKFKLTGLVESKIEIIILLVFIFVFCCMWRKNGNAKIKTLSLVLILLCCLSFSATAKIFRKFQKKLILTFLEVGHGDALFIEFPYGKTMLVDSGAAFGEFDIGQRVIEPFLYSKRIHKIDYAVLSHADMDHSGGFSTVFKEFKVGEFWVTPQKEEGSNLAKLVNQAIKKGIKVFEKNLTSSSIDIEGAHISFLWPPPNCKEKNRNGCSLVMDLNFSKTEFLLTGDIEKEQEEKLVTQSTHYSMENRILKIPHHGSSTSSSDIFLKWFAPQMCVISSGFRKPNNKVLSRLKQNGLQIFRTDESGAILVSVTDLTRQIRTTR